MEIPGKSTNRHTDMLVPFFLITFTITWGLGAFAIFLPGQFEAAFGRLTDTHPLYFAAVAAPTLAATLLTWAREGRRGLSSLYSRLIRWRFGLRWYVLVLIGIPALGWVVSRFTGSHPLKQAGTPAEFAWLLFYLLITGPLGEELGWRGFALPRLLRRFNPFAASLILGILWGVWHLPSFFLSGMVQSGLSLPVFILLTPCLGLFVTWVFKHSGGSVLITVLIHYMVNFSATILGVPLPAMGIVLFAAALLVLLLDKEFGWFRKAGPGTPVVKPSPAAI